MIPAGGQIVFEMQDSWAYSTASDKSISVLTAKTTGTEVLYDDTSSHILTISNFADVAANTPLMITLTNVQSSTGSTKINFVKSLVSKDELGNEINTWDTTHPDSTKIEITTTTSTTKYISSGWELDIIPDNAKAPSKGDARMKFKLDTTLCKGTVLSIEYPSSIMAHTSIDIKDFCWSKTQYKSCGASGSKLNLVLNEEVASGSYIELYVEETITLPSTDAETT
jgi:hypothetical protein